MWFKQIKIFDLPRASTYPIDSILENMDLLSFHPCPPSINSSVGWVSPIENIPSPLARKINDCIMLCLQIEEKLLPSAVIKHELIKRIREIEKEQDRKIRFKEKLSMKDEVIFSLLPRAFSKFTKVYGYIDVQNNWLIINTSNTKKCEQFLSLFRKSVTEDVEPLKIDNISSKMTQWLLHPQFSNEIAIEDSCFLQDLEHQQKTVRCKHLDLSSENVQHFIKEGCSVKQLVLSWQDRITFNLQDDFSIQGIQYQDEIKQYVKEMSPEGDQQEFDVNFWIMAENLRPWIKALLTSLDFKEEKLVASESPETPVLAD